MQPEIFFINLEIGKWNAIIGRQFEGFIKREMKDYDVTYNEFFFLMGIGQGDEVEDKAHFVESLCIDKGMASRQLKALECKGYLKIPKVRTPGPEHFWQITLTARGQKAQAAGRKIMEMWIEIVFKDIDMAASEQLLALNRQMAKNVLSVTSPTTIKTGKLPI